MASIKKSVKTKKNTSSKLLGVDQMFKTSPKLKNQKRKREVQDEENAIGVAGYSTKMNENHVVCESSQKLLNSMKIQQEQRKQANTGLLANMSDMIYQIEADHDVLKNNEEKLKYMTDMFIKCAQQSSSAYKQNLTKFKEIQNKFAKEVEGLITRGAMKPDDRPVWFDIYRAFPSIREPKFAQPKPENPIKPIFYKEDPIRAEFHSLGHGKGTINMLNPAGNTHIKRLINQYEKLKAEGIPENELIEKTVAAVDIDRQMEAPVPKVTKSNPESVTGQVIAEADLKNIFKE